MCPPAYYAIVLNAFPGGYTATAYSVAMKSASGIPVELGQLRFEKGIERGVVLLYLNLKNNRSGIVKNPSAGFLRCSQVGTLSRNKINVWLSLPPLTTVILASFLIDNFHCYTWIQEQGISES